MSHFKHHSSQSFFGAKKQFNFRHLFTKVKGNKHWYILSLLVCGLTAFLYLRYITPIYRTTSEILITDDKAPNPADDALSKAFGGQFGTGNGAEGEAEILRTRQLMKKVVQSMKAYITYYHKGKVRQVELYKTSPFTLRLLGSAEKIIPQELEINIKDNQVRVKGDDFTKQVDLYQQFMVPGIGKVQIERGFETADPDQTYTVKIEELNETVIDFMDRLKVEIPIAQVKVLSLNFNGEVPLKSEDVLNKLIESFVEGTLSNKNKIADSTIAFIENRLIYVGRELGGIEGNVQRFKQKNKITDISAQSKELITSTKESVADLAKMETQISILNSIDNYLADTRAMDRIVPNGALLDDPGFAALVERYNVILMEKERNSISQTEKNPYIKNLNIQLAGARADMLASLRSLRKTLLISRDRIQSRASGVASQVRDVPAVERTYLDLTRQQEIKQDLYVFLLQKREETAISKTSNISNCNIIEPPVSYGPVSPVKVNVIGYGLVLGLFGPLGIFLLRERLNTRIVSKEQVLNFIQVPIIGEIGHSNNSSRTIVVEKDSRTLISEQFRSLRTNLSFFIKGNEKTILLTSSTSGEGKSFASLNLATVLAISGKKVVVMEMDLRRPNISNKLNLKNDFGFTNYIVSPEVLPEHIIKPSGAHENLYVITSGHIPPNPAEIIMDVRTDLLMKELVEKFDYIIIDAPPAEVITDAQLLSKYSDLTLYVVRQGCTYRDQLAIPQDLYVNQKMKNVTILMNDVNKGSNYSYGYGYGYLDKEEHIGFFKKLFKK